MSEEDVIVAGAKVASIILTVLLALGVLVLFLSNLMGSALTTMVGAA